MKWRLHPNQFNGPGTYNFGTGAAKITIKVDKDGIFELKEQPRIPLYPIAAHETRDPV